jgi:predicted negative regulator of RcsB-dependent stress response
VKIKRGLIVFALLLGMGAGVFYLMKSRNAKTEDKNLSEAINALEKNEEAKALTDLQAGIYRLAAEERLRTAQTKGDLDEAIKFLNTARDRVLRGSDHVYDRQAELVEIAATYCQLGGTPEQLNKEVRLRWDDVQKHVRQTLEKIGDDELKKIGIQRITRELAEFREVGRAVDVAKQIFGPGELPEVIGIVGMELMRMGKKEMAAEFLKKKAGSMVDASGINNSPSLTALRISLGSVAQPAPLNNLGVIRAPDSNLTEEGRQAYVEALIFAGDPKAALDLANRNGVPQSRLKTYLNAAEKLLIDNAKEQALPFLEGARNVLLKEGKSAGITPWLRVRCVHLLARGGKADQAAEIADQLEKELQPWARVELLRGRLLGGPTETADESWVLTVPENSKPRLAHGVARELFARHQAALGNAVPLDNLSPLLKPFAQLAVLLGNRGSGVANRE